MQTIIAPPPSSTLLQQGIVRLLRRVHCPWPKVQHPVQLLQPQVRLRERVAPGVTSGILKPSRLWNTPAVLDKEPRITSSHCRPGDPMATGGDAGDHAPHPQGYPHMLFCLSSNGLAMPIPGRLAELGVTHAR